MTDESKNLGIELGTFAPEEEAATWWSRYRIQSKESQKNHPTSWWSRKRVLSKHYAPGELSQAYIDHYAEDVEVVTAPADADEPSNKITPAPVLGTNVYPTDKIITKFPDKLPIDITGIRTTHLKEFKAIAEYYKELADGDKTCSKGYRLWSGHFYRGEIKQTRINKFFIRVIDRFTLLNKKFTQSTIETLSKRLNNNTFSTLIFEFSNMFKSAQAYYEHYLQCVITEFCDENKDEISYINYLLSNQTNKIQEGDFTGNISSIKRYNILKELYKIKKIKSNIENQLMSLKDDINRLAEELWVDYKIKQQNTQEHNDSENINAAEETDDISSSSSDSFSDSDSDTDSKSDTDTNSVTKKKAPTYQPFHFGFALYEENSLPSAREKKDRRIKRNCARASKATSLFVGLGEGAVAAFGAAALFAVMPWLIITIGITVFICGFICNSYLVKDDSYKTLVQLFMGKGWGWFSRKILEDDNGNIVSHGKKVGIAIAAVLSLSAGCAYGILSASAIAGVMGLTGAAAIAIAFFPVVFTAIGLASMLFVVISDIIKNDRWKDVKNYFANEFFFANVKGAVWKELSGLEKTKHVIACIGKSIKVTIALFLCVAITVASFGLFYFLGKKIIGYVTSKSHASAIAKLIAYSNGIVFGTFSVKKIVSGVCKITLEDCISVALNTVTTYPIFIVGAIAEILVRAVIVTFIIKPIHYICRKICQIFGWRKNKSITFNYTPNFTSKFCTWWRKRINNIASSIVNFGPIKACRNLFSKSVTDYKTIDKDLLQRADKRASAPTAAPAPATTTPQNDENKHEEKKQPKIKKVNHVQKVHNEILETKKVATGASVMLNALAQTALFTKNTAAQKTSSRDLGPVTNKVASTVEISNETAALAAAALAAALYSSTPNAEAINAANAKEVVSPVRKIGLFGQSSSKTEPTPTNATTDIAESASVAS